MGDHDDGDAISVEVLEQLDDLLCPARVQVPGGFVCQHDRWASNDRAGDRNALTLAARELGGAVLEPVGEPDALQRGGRELAPLTGVDAAVDQPVGDVLEGGLALE